MNEEQTSGGVDRGQIMLVGLVVLAFIASIVMLFTDSDGALKLALLAALWAAILGFFLVFRYRREADTARRELSHHAELHDVEVARASAEREARADTRALELRDQQHARDTEVLKDIQRELAGIRAQLEELAGREFEYEPAALRAEAQRIMELERVTFSDPAEFDEPDESEIPEPAEPPKVDGRITGAPSLDAVTGRLGQQPTRPQANPLADLIAENARREEMDETRVFDTGSFQAVSWAGGGRKHSAEPEPAAEPETTPVVKQETITEQEDRRGRRRRDEKTEGVSVAELLARSRDDQE
ncbi:DUF6779 domain-containing protein [Corynebacterium comes]|uniref:DUF6779 domain-containing protein n=1 Tax=Corynebacterium comes TaxID=2675218 RepID=A0A6B8VW36_9CORY|nr:DUF6779 domain-containing protein [Corynebacterium comes]QGU05554.1 hypothetical protein CETAM_11610 [Corynebacterium comes]